MKTILFFAGLFVIAVYSNPLGGIDKRGASGVWSNLTQSQRDQLNSIMRDENQTRAQMTQRLQQFANTLSGSAQVRF